MGTGSQQTRSLPQEDMPAPADKTGAIPPTLNPHALRSPSNCGACLGLTQATKHGNRRFVACAAKRGQQPATITASSIVGAWASASHRSSHRAEDLALQRRQGGEL